MHIVKKITIFYDVNESFSDFFQKIFIYNIKRPENSRTTRLKTNGQLNKSFLIK